MHKFLPSREISDQILSPYRAALLVIALNSAGRRSLLMMVWRQHHINNTSPLSPSVLQPSVLQLSMPKFSEGKFEVLLAYNVHETLGI